MNHQSLPTHELERCIDRMNDGDANARNELLQHCGRRLETLARRMLRDFPNVQRWEQTGDVLQNALVRLISALADVQPMSFRHFLSLATLQIRRELIDLARKHQGPLGDAANHVSWRTDSQTNGAPPSPDANDATHEPSQLAIWCELHETIEQLPEDQREICDLIWYQGISQVEAAKILNVSERTIKRRWQAVRLRLHDCWISPDKRRGPS